MSIKQYSINSKKKTIDFSNELCKKNYRLYLHYKKYTKTKNIPKKIAKKTLKVK
jgi:hypothetical protein